MDNPQPNTRPMRIAIEGNIGAGKSTCTNLIKEALGNVAVVTEPLNIWTALPNVFDPSKPINMLDHYYQDQKKYAFPFQVLVQNSYTQKCLQAESKPHTAIVTERTLASSSEIFSKVAVENGNLSVPEMAVLTHHTNLLQDYFRHLLEYDLIIYLRCSPEQCYNRMRKRQRAEEQATVELSYLECLDKAYESWMAREFKPLNAKKIAIVNNAGQTVKETKASVLKLIGVNGMVPSCDSKENVNVTSLLAV